MFLESNPTIRRAACAARRGLLTNFRIPSCGETAERAASLLCLIVGAIHESPDYENQIFYRRTTNGRPYGQILNCINRSRRIKKHCSRDVQRTFLRAPSCRGACSRRFDSIKSVCNGGTKAPPYNAPLTHLRWELPPRGASRKKLPRKENAIIHNRLRVTLSGAGMLANAGRGRRR